MTTMDPRTEGALYGGLHRYQHIERLGHDEVQGLLDSGGIVVQEKLDGANATVAMVDGKLIVASRNQALSINGDPSTGFRGLVEYVLLRRAAIESVLRTWDGWTLRGEWLVNHSLAYDKDAYGALYIFDVQDAAGNYIHPDDYTELLRAAGLKVVPEIARFEVPTDVARLTELVTTTPSALGASHIEGIVVKRYDFRNQYGRATWGKVVHADFKVKNSLSFGPTKHDPSEIALAALITPAEVRKLIDKIGDERGTPADVRDMMQVLGRTYHDLIEDYLWDMIARPRQGKSTIDFHALKKLVEQKTRGIALNIFNGVEMVTEQDPHAHLPRLQPGQEPEPMIPMGERMT